MREGHLQANKITTCRRQIIFSLKVEGRNLRDKKMNLDMHLPMNEKHYRSFK